jgi:FixJ family two-component response regulator
MSVQAMKAGAQDFLTKPVRDQTFLDAVSKAIATDISRRNALSAADKYVSLFETLTVRERQVLKLVVSGEVNKQIAFSLGISEFTVKLHRSNMMKKMQVSSVAQLFNVWQALPSHVRMNDG